MRNNEFSVMLEDVAAILMLVTEMWRTKQVTVSVPRRKGAKEIAFHDLVRVVDTTLVAVKVVERLAKFLPGL